MKSMRISEFRRAELKADEATARKAAKWTRSRTPRTAGREPKHLS
ncbi:hypothetical protein J2Z31_005469 [Sinorhizobium kostiense]|uniref:Uncharacterized protein n=1 Tax=Sinorhizobium kostiense TaxID=76747 RepID=A0ABS4R7T6_9HYPH|nr:hypothetical protein [Sinorhizobium kostiense]